MNNVAIGVPVPSVKRISPPVLCLIDTSLSAVTLASIWLRIASPLLSTPKSAALIAAAINSASVVVPVAVKLTVPDARVKLPG